MGETASLVSLQLFQFNILKLQHGFYQVINNSVLLQLDGLGQHNQL